MTPTDLGRWAVDDVTVAPDVSLRDAMHRIDRTGLGIVVVVDGEGRLAGTATDGDIRRGILDGVGLDAPVSAVANETPVAVGASWDRDDVVERVPRERLEAVLSGNGRAVVPVLDERGRVVDYTFLLRNGRVASADRRNRAVATVLVIGGAGYIGSVLCRRLLDRGYEVRVLDTLLYGADGVDGYATDDRFTLVEGDMRSIEAIVEATEGVDAVVHLGGLVGDPASSIDPRRTLELNYHSVKVVADICKYHQINRFLFASTCSVYGRSTAEGELLTETSGLNPVSLYARTKIEAERALLGMADGHFAPTILRMATVYGLSPRMRFDLVVNVLSAKAHEEGVIPIFGGEQYRPHVHVADAARAYIDCLDAPLDAVGGEVFNVGSTEQNYRIVEVGRIVNEVFPDARIERRRDEEDERSYRVDFSKIGEVLGYRVERTVADGCAEIGAALDSGAIPDYTDRRYNNYRTLEDRIASLGTT